MTPKGACLHDDDFFSILLKVSIVVQFIYRKLKFVSVCDRVLCQISHEAQVNWYLRVTKSAITPMFKTAV